MSSPESADYIPQFKDPHSFVDIAMDVVIDGDVAWMVGMSQGKHNDDEDAAKYLRGILVPKNLHTGKAAGSAIVAPPRALWPQSAFFGAALHPEGVVVTGYGCDETCSKHRIETSRYSVDGTRTWFTTDATNSGLAYGSDVALDSQGRALVAGAVTQNGTLRGYVFGREVGEDKGPILFDHWYPGAGSSEALGIVRDTFDRIFPAGYSTVDGEAQKWRGEAASRPDACGAPLHLVGGVTGPGGHRAAREPGRLCGRPAGRPGWPARWPPGARPSAAGVAISATW